MVGKPQKPGLASVRFLVVFEPINPFLEGVLAARP